MRELVGTIVGLLIGVAGIRLLHPPQQSAPVLAAPPYIEQLEEAVQREAHPKNLIHLAVAYLREAQQTRNVRFHARAEQTCNRLLAMDSPTAEVLALEALSQAGQHRFREAIASAQRAIELNPDSPAAYGALADASIELGEYEQAATAVQRMLDLKPSGAAYARAAYLRSLHGDQAGGLALMKLAVEASSPRGDRQWMLVHLAHDQLAAGRANAARRSYEEILSQDPEHAFALTGLARIAGAQGDYAGAVTLLERALEHTPDPDAHAALGDVLAAWGKPQEAQRHYQAAERLERAELRGPGAPEHRHLALLLADLGTELEEAVRLARLDAARRDDIYTADTLAWALFRSGRVAEASAVTQRALRLGTKDPILLYHAGMIAAASNDGRGAARLLEEALRRPALLGPVRVAGTLSAYQLMTAF